MAKNPARSDNSGTGLIIGKFMPPHRGHMHLIDFARKRVNHLMVLVCSLSSEPIPGKLRYEWMRELFPDVDIRHHRDENPQEPHEHPDFWEVWSRSIRKFCPEGPDVVFTSEDYGDQLAACLGARHICVDPDRKKFAISGIQVRKDPYRNWEYIPACVRAYYVKRVVVIGAESTGKTTMVRRLARHYDTVWLPEYGREYIDKKQAPPELADILKIARGHLAGEEALARKANRILICDTDLIVTRILSEYYFGTCPGEVRRASYQRTYDLYLLTDMDFPWEADPLQREGPEIREMLHNRFRNELEQRNLPHRIISGSIEERLKIATSAIDRLFAIQ